jgi:NhaC family Na+:H+ antiporter
LGYTWKEILKSIVDSIDAALPAILILLLIGSLAGTWLISGVVPALIYYGLKLIHPSIFLFAAVVTCSIVSLVTGSSWSTVATIGVALNGIGLTLGIHPGLVAGAIISGACFGDKMSPVSDTTNLGPAVAGTDLFTHVRYMMITTVPPLTLTLIIFLVIGFTYNFIDTTANVDNVLRLIEGNFNLNPLLFLVPVVLIVVIVKKVAPVPALLSRTLEDGGTVTSVLVPWNTCGATQSRVLGVSTLTCLPYCFFCLISPLMSIFIASLNYRIRRFKPGEEK